MRVYFVVIFVKTIKMLRCLEKTLDHLGELGMHVETVRIINVDGKTVKI